MVDHKKGHGKAGEPQSLSSELVEVLCPGLCSCNDEHIPSYLH